MYLKFLKSDFERDENLFSSLDAIYWNIISR